MTSADIIILGTNGNCIDIAEAVELLRARGDGLRVAGFLDDNARTVTGYTVLGKITDAGRFPGASFVNGIGSPASFRRKPAIIQSANIPLERWAIVIHPVSTVSRHAQLGAGTVVLSGSSIGARATIGTHTMILQNSVVSHDAVVGDYCAIATGVCVSGNVVVGRNCYLGSGCCVKEGVRIGDGTLVGLGAVVTRNVEPGAVVIGNPARPYRK